MSVDPDRLLLMGRLGRTHGVRGEIKVVPETDDPARFAGVERLYIGDRPEAARPYGVEGVRFQYPKGRVVPLIAFEGVETVEAADALKGQGLYADPVDLPDLEDGETYLHDLIGLEVVEVDADGKDAAEPFGRVRDLYDGAQLLFAIERPGLPEVLLPDVDEFVDRIDLEARRLYVRLPEGLVE